MKRIFFNALMLFIVIVTFYEKEFFENFNFKEFSLYFLSGALLVSLIHTIANFKKNQSITEQSASLSLFRIRLRG